ncbi:acetyl-CoA carboxylase biotin carboxyl carrier protein [Lutibacter sp.]|uniref:acetyl-CoA carboxylase biotin carboxyl carrier protein n=1 Tax=Lutibacter sp. TaxID=1925666 RepID=UPI0027333E57|nr:acetyl-CoA carboxylase biotin carboxyl carrier protein [Lutibacter sp.]MDP3313606.1 acetyl-CoA carboxylase biotin carboxyl carrier protein [Lutibacter sp.]
MDLRDIQNLIKFVAKSGASEVKLEMEDIKITIKTGGERSETTYIQQAPMGMQQMPMVASSGEQVSQPTVSAEIKAAEISSKYIEIKSPIIGTFYRRSSPDKPVFVEVGDIVSNNTVVCIIEAMKLFNEIESEISGKIVKILVENGTPVEFGQPLFLVDPS